MTDTLEHTRETPFRGPIGRLQPEDVGLVRQTWDARYTHADLRFMAASPEWLVLWNSQTGEHIVGGPWRHRRDVLEITEIAGSGGAIELVQAFVEEAAQSSVELVLIPERLERRKEPFYAAVGFEDIEQIIIYEIHNLRPPRHRPLTPTFERIDMSNASQRNELIELDHATFPWLWLNSSAEFDNYAAANGVAIEMARDSDGQPLAYVGYTRLRGWGHLDRIAVSPAAQGRGLGRVALEYAVARMVGLGARRVGLSTQADNHVSRKLYESFGFRRNSAHDYRLYGRWTGERRPV